MWVATARSRSTTPSCPPRSAGCVGSGHSRRVLFDELRYQRNPLMRHVDLVTWLCAVDNAAVSFVKPADRRCCRHALWRTRDFLPLPSPCCVSRGLVRNEHDFHGPMARVPLRSLRPPSSRDASFGGGDLLPRHRRAQGVRGQLHSTRSTCAHPLPNAGCSSTTSTTPSAARRAALRPHAFFADVDRFKLITDSFGHHAASVLIAIAARMRCAAPGDRSLDSVATSSVLRENSTAP